MERRVLREVEREPLRRLLPELLELYESESEYESSLSEEELSDMVFA